METICCLENEASSVTPCSLSSRPDATPLLPGDQGRRLYTSRGRSQLPKGSHADDGARLVPDSAERISSTLEHGEGDYYRPAHSELHHAHRESPDYYRPNSRGSLVESLGDREDYDLAGPVKQHYRSGDTPALRGVPSSDYYRLNFSKPVKQTRNRRRKSRRGRKSQRTRKSKESPEAEVDDLLGFAFNSLSDSLSVLDDDHNEFATISSIPLVSDLILQDLNRTIRIERPRTGSQNPSAIDPILGTGTERLWIGEGQMRIRFDFLQSHQREKPFK